LILDLGRVFVQVIVPVLLVGGFGYLVGRVRPIDLGPITALSVSVLVPGVVFDSLARAALPPAVLGRLVLHVMVQVAAIGCLALLAARLVGWQGSARGALLLATMFPNTGNLGLPLALFAFGPAGLALAGGWFAISAIHTHTLGVFIAAHARAGARAALGQLPRLPITYAIAAGVAVNLSGWPLPAPIAKASQLLANGSVAVLLLLLGLQLSRLTFREEARGAVLATAIRLLAAPPIAWLGGRLVGLEGLALAVAVLQASTPTAVVAFLWAMEFDTRPALVSASVVLSTLAGVVTLTVLLALLL
jgi:hypothetical protein